MFYVFYDTAFEGTVLSLVGVSLHFIHDRRHIPRVALINGIPHKLNATKNVVSEVFMYDCDGFFRVGIIVASSKVNANRAAGIGFGIRNKMRRPRLCYVFTNSVK